MSIQKQERRDFIGMAFGAVAAVGGAFALVGMKKSWDPLPSVKAAGFTTVDLSPMQPGEFRQVANWAQTICGRPFLKRTNRQDQASTSL